MKRKALLIIIALAALTLSATAAFAQKEKDKEKFKDKNFEPGVQMERAIPAAQNVAVSVCLTSGNILVHGWDRPEVKVTATSVRQLELQGGGLNPSQRVDVMASNRAENAPGEPLLSECRAITDMEINVPRGATVDIKLRTGDIQISDVAEARIKNLSGDITLSNITRAVEASTINGDLELTNSAGRVRLANVSGDIDATNIRAVEAGDDFSVTTTSGDIDLVNVAQARLNANSTSGMITLTGELARRGNYDFNTFSGDVVLNLPQTSAFRISAKTPQGTIATDFAIKSTSDADSQSLLQEGRLSGAYGSGDWASLNINSFSGTVRLQKR
ncbi:MAG: DUF4097 family beta strand repeat protein [Pyrinomonadaceae bacterium]|nr:DUF4097 family beta strand repeat protein [Pyrinomonadaceae bacterium]